jgi:T5SS/PEP-CTERM-associated repeat protein
MTGRKLFSFLSASALLFSLSSVSLGQDFFNAATGDWDVASNWASGALPAGGTLPDGSNNRTYVGSTAGGMATATATISGVLTQPAVGELRIGSSADGGAATGTVGVVNHSAGTLDPQGWSFVGHDAGMNLGTYNLSGGTLNSGSVLALGVAGGGDNTGVMNVSGNAVLNTNLGDGGFAIGWDLGNEGELNQTGGTINSNWVTVGANSAGTTGTFNMSAGQFNANGLTIGENDGATGTTNVSGMADMNLTDLLVGRNDGGTGTLNVIGSGSTIDVSNNFFVGLNDGGGETTATGTVSFTADSSGVTAIVAGNVSLSGDGSNLVVDMTSHPNGDCSVGPCTDILLVDNMGAGAVSGIFDGLAEGTPVANSGGRVISYLFGDGNDIGLVFVPEPSSILMIFSGLALLAFRRR